MYEHDFGIGTHIAEDVLPPANRICEDGWAVVRSICGAKQKGGEGDGGREVRAKKERTSGSAFLHKKKQNNVYLIVSNQAHEHIRQKA